MFHFWCFLQIETYTQCRKSFCEMQERRQSEIKKAVCQGFASVLQTLAPKLEDDATIFRMIIETNSMDKYLNGKVEASGILEDIILTHNECGSYRLRLLAVSHVAGKLGFAYLSQFNEGTKVRWSPKLTKSFFFAARRENLDLGHGLVKPDETKTFKQRLDPMMLKTLYDFLNGPNMVQTMAFGTASKKTETGRKLTMTKLVRLYDRPQLIQMSTNYLKDLGFEPPCLSIYYEIFDNMPSGEENE